MTREQWTALAARCEAAEEEDREIDWAIGLATGWRRDIYDGNDMLIDWEGNMFPEHPGAIWPSVTDSLDTITALIEQELPGHSWRTGNLPSRRGFAFLGTSKAEHVAATPALALCAAFCRAMAERAAT